MTEVREANSELQKSVTTQLSLCHPERSEGAQNDSRVSSY